MHQLRDGHELLERLADPHLVVARLAGGRASTEQAARELVHTQWQARNGDMPGHSS